MYINKFCYLKDVNIDTKNNYIEHIKIIKVGITASELINIFINYINLKTLLLGCDMNNFEEHHYEMYPNAFNCINRITDKINNSSNCGDAFKCIKFNTINIIFDTNCHIPSNYLLNIEVLYITHTGLPSYIIEEIILASNNLQKIRIRAIDSGYLYLILIAMDKKNIKYIEVYDNSIQLDFVIVLDIFRKLSILTKVTKLKILTVDISGGNGHFYQTNIKIYCPDIKIRFVLQYIITQTQMQEIFNLCPNIEELYIFGGMNGDEPIYIHLFEHDIIFPPLLTKITIAGDYDEYNIINIMNKIHTIKEIHFGIGCYSIDTLYQETNILDIIETTPDIKFVPFLTNHCHY